MSDGGRSLRDIGRRIVALREAMGLNQTAFSKACDLSQPAINNYEKGIRRPDLDSAIKIQLRTGATLDWIYLGDRTGLPHHLLMKLPDLSGEQSQAG